MTRVFRLIVQPYKYDAYSTLDDTLDIPNNLNNCSWTQITQFEFCSPVFFNQSPESRSKSHVTNDSFALTSTQRWLADGTTTARKQPSSLAKIAKRGINIDSKRKWINCF